MSLEATFESLRHELARLQEAVSALHVTVTEDKPACGAAVLVEQLDNLVTDLSSDLEEADAHALQVVQSGPLNNARSALRKIHELMNRFTASYVCELAAHDRIAQLLEMGGERGREWLEWSQVVKTAIERCATPMKMMASASLECWSELTERMGPNSVSGQATRIREEISRVKDQLGLAKQVN